MKKYQLVTSWVDSSYTTIKKYHVYLGDDKKTGFAKYKDFETEKEAQNFIKKNNGKEKTIQK